MMNLYRDINSMPVFAKAGAVVPFQEEYGIDAGENPRQLHLYVYAGADGSFTLYEDKGDGFGYEAGEYCLTKLCWQEAERRLVTEKVRECDKITERYRIEKILVM